MYRPSDTSVTAFLTSDRWNKNVMLIWISWSVLISLSKIKSFHSSFRDNSVKHSLDKQKGGIYKISKPINLPSVWDSYNLKHIHLCEMETRFKHLKLHSKVMQYLTCFFGFFFKSLKGVTGITCDAGVCLFTAVWVCRWNETSLQNHKYSIQTTQANPVESYLCVIKIPLDLKHVLQCAC